MVRRNIDGPWLSCGLAGDSGRGLITSSQSSLSIVPLAASLRTADLGGGRPICLSVVAGRQREVLKPQRQVWHRSALPWLSDLPSVDAQDKQGGVIWFSLKLHLYVGANLDGCIGGSKCP